MPMLGVLGGMGPLATVDFLEKLVLQTQATRDQDHIPFLVACLPQIPDRMEALLRGGPSPSDAMVDGIDRLVAGGADVIAIPCNTAHAWYDELAARSPVPILHIVHAVLDALRDRGIERGPIGLLATEGTIKADIYQSVLREQGLECRLPSKAAPVDVGIYAVKVGRLEEARTGLAAVVRTMLYQGCTAIIFGCTEISVALGDVADFRDVTVDASAALARVALKRCGARLLPS
ncbi:MAG: amino acid racemase [Pseudomonadota bacterium]|nr:amino acid racemase [Pseudomonadota bacterium]